MTNRNPFMRHTALAMAVVFTYVNVIYGAIQPAKNLWQERRDAAQKTLLAQLPAAFSQPIDSLPVAGSRIPESFIQDLAGSLGRRFGSQTAGRVPASLKAIPASCADIK